MLTQVSGHLHKTNVFTCELRLCHSQAKGFVMCISLWFMLDSNCVNFPNCWTRSFSCARPLTFVYPGIPVPKADLTFFFSAMWLEPPSLLQPMKHPPWHILQTSCGPLQEAPQRRGDVGLGSCCARCAEPAGWQQPVRTVNLWSACEVVWGSRDTSAGPRTGKDVFKSKCRHRRRF